MKTLFLSLNKNYILDSAGSNVVFKYDLLNDILYELGAELAFMTKDDSIGDKAKIITDVKDARPEAFDEIVDKIRTLVVGKLLMPEIPEETTIPLPEAYVDWLAYNSNQSYAEIGKKVRNAGNKVTLCLTDIYDEYISGKVLPRVRDIIVANDEINKFAIVDHNDSESKVVKTIIDMKSGLDFEPYDGPWLQYEIGYALGNGVGTVKDLKEAFKHYLTSAEKRNPLAANWVGWCYQQGLGTKSDLSKALIWYNVGAELKNHAAEANAAYFYGNGIGTEVNINKAAELYERALSDNNNIGFALNNLAYIYYNGKLGEPNYEKAFHFFERGASIEEVAPNCAYMVGYMLHNGQGVERNDKEALAYLERASKNGVQAAHYLAGKLHAEGAGTDFGTEDLVKAKTAYQRGRDAGDDKCALELARIYIKEGSSSVSDIIDNFKFAADKNNNDAAFELAKFIHDNKGADVNLGDSYSPVALLAKLSAANYPGAEELRAQYQKEIDDENARIEQEKREREEAESARIREEQERERRIEEEQKARKRRYEETSKRQQEIKKIFNDIFLRNDGEDNDVIEVLVKEARFGDPLSKAMLGMILLRRDSTNKQAKNLLLSSIKPVSEQRLIDFYNSLSLDAEDEGSAPIQKNGGVQHECYALVGHMYLAGLGVEKDPYKGVDYLKISVGEAKDPENKNFSLPHQYDKSKLGLTLLGFCYYKGIGVAKDLKKAEEYFSTATAISWDEAAEAGYFLASIYAQQNLSKLLDKYLVSSAKAGNPMACRDYGKMLIEKGENAQAEEWLHRAIKNSGGNKVIIERAQQLLRQIGGRIIEYKETPIIPVYFD